MNQSEVKKDFWKSAGLHLVERNSDGWLVATPDLMRAYYTRPEIHPVEESCQAEHRLFEKLMAEPFAAVDESELAAIADQDTAFNYQVVLRFRDVLHSAGTIEGAYLTLFSGKPISIPPVFIDQMVHLILRNCLASVTDPMIPRVAELFFREQAVTVGEDQLMLADQEIVEMKSRDGFGGLGELLAEAGTPAREIALDVMTEENAERYWECSDRFDMAIDFRFTQPASDAFGRVIEMWLRHFLRVETRVEARKSIRDEQWSWHIGCDATATWLLNALYNGDVLDEKDLFRILALYRLEFLNPLDVDEALRGKPIYLAVAMTNDRRVVVKPQNLLTNLPLSAARA